MSDELEREFSTSSRLLFIMLMRRAKGGKEWHKGAKFDVTLAGLEKEREREKEEEPRKATQDAATYGVTEDEGI